MATRRAPSVRLATAAATIGCAAALTATVVFGTDALTARGAVLVASVEVLLLGAGLAVRSAAALAVAIAWLGVVYAYAAGGALETAGFAIGLVLLAELAFGAAEGRMRIAASAAAVAASTAVAGVVAAAAQLRVSESVWLEPIGAGAVIAVAVALMRAGPRVERDGRPASPRPSDRFGRLAGALASRRK
ncbi:MAG TPA: hypothetical protein VF101_07030 [Gaiellaceae bacterium]